MRSNISTGEENFLHITGIRLRITGNGNLKATFFSLDDTRSYPLVDLIMASAPGRNLDRLANVPQEQRVYLELKTTEIDETFRLNRIIIWAKQVSVELPG